MSQQKSKSATNDSLITKLGELQKSFEKAKSDQECLQAIWRWLSSDNMFFYYEAELKNKKEIKALATHLFKRLIACCLETKRCWDQLPNYSRIERTIKATINRIHREQRKRYVSPI